MKFLGCAPSACGDRRGAEKVGRPSPSRPQLTSTAASWPAMRSPDEWATHPQAAAVAAAPVVQIEKIGDAPPRPLPKGTRPLSGLRVLDLTRIIAGPVAGRALAAHGADVMRISAPRLPFIDWLVKDTGRGKLSAYRRYRHDRDGRAALRGSSATPTFSCKPFGRIALAARGFGPSEVAALRPGIVYGSLSAYGASRTVGLAPRLRFIGADGHRLQCRRSLSRRRRGTEGIALPGARSRDRLSARLRRASWRACGRPAKAAAGWCAFRWRRTGRWIWTLGRVENGFSCRASIAR